MKSTFLALMMTLSCVASAGSNQDAVLEGILKMIPVGVHQGKTATGEVCRVNVSVAVQQLAIAVTPASFNFDEERGSEKCMYSKACFVASDSSETLNVESSASEISMTVKSKGGGPDMAARSKMSIHARSVSGGVVVTVSEGVGPFGLMTTESSCKIAN